MKSEEMKSRPNRRVMRMTWPLSINEGPNQKPVIQISKTIAAINPIEEASNHLDSTGVEVQIMGTMPTGTTNTATSAATRPP
jgi:hypothetical protein